MCLNDWRLGRLIRTKRTAVILNAAASQSFSADRTRVGIAFGLGTPNTSTTVHATINCDTLPIAFLNLHSPFLQWDLATNGELPTLAWSIAAVVSAFNGTVVEYFAPEAVLAAAIQEFSRRY
jgi:hypothetical protein